MGTRMHPDNQRMVLAQVVRNQLAAVYQRGVDTAPHGVNALADPHAKESFKAIMTAANDMAESVAYLWREQLAASKRGDQP